ncbi:MAG: mechanosensitive ion channel family protein [Bacteroidia bacterium]
MKYALTIFLIYSAFLLKAQDYNSAATADSAAATATIPATDNPTEKTAKNIIDQTSTNLENIAGSTIFTFKNILIAIILLVINWFIIKLIQRLLEKFAERSTQHRITIKGFIPIVAIVFWVLAVYIVIVDVFDPPRETLLAGLASAGIAVGLAAQDIIKNVFAGLVIIFDSPFRVGDKIEVSSHYGEVKQIGLRSTKIITPDDSMVTIPNSEMMNNSVSNSNTGEANCQVVAELYLPPEIDTVLVRKKSIEAAQVSKYIYLNKPIAVLFFNVVEDGVPFIKMRLKAYVSDIRNEFAFKSDMTELVMKQLFAEGILNQNYFMNHGS